MPLYNPFIDYINKLRNISTVTNQWNRSNDYPIMLNTITASALALPRPLLAPLNNADFYSLRINTDNLFQTNTSLKANVNVVSRTYCYWYKPYCKFIFNTFCFYCESNPTISCIYKNLEWTFFLQWTNP